MSFLNRATLLAAAALAAACPIKQPLDITPPRATGRGYSYPAHSAGGRNMQAIRAARKLRNVKRFRRAAR